MSVATREQTRASRKSAAELMEELNSDTAKLHAWIRTQANSPAQRPWFADTSDSPGQLGSGRVAVNQLKMLPHRWRWREISPYLFKIAEIAHNAEVKPIETTDRQGILLTNPGLGGRLQITNSIRCSVAIYNPGDIAPAHIHSPNASRTILSEKGGYTNVEGERCECRRGDIVLNSERHLARSRQFRFRADDLDRYAGLAADRVSGLRLGGSGLFRRDTNQLEIAARNPQRWAFDPNVRPWRDEASIHF